MPAAAQKFRARDIGKYKRSYDEIALKDEDDETQEDLEEAEILAEVLKWTKERTPDPFSSLRKSAAYKDLMKAGVDIERLAPGAAMHALRSSPIKEGLIDRAFDLIKDVYYAARDILAGKKVKTALTILAGIAIGAGAGAAIGTLAMPVIGTAGGAIFGAISGALATVVPLLGGTIGLTILGAVIGGAVGRFASDKIYKNERRFGLSKRVSLKIKERTGVRSRTAELINGYLYNRTKTAKDPVLKRLYKDLRKEGIHRAEPAVMEKIARFFCHELTLLQREIDPTHEDVELQEEIAAVVHILESLQESNKFSKATRRRIKTTLDAYRVEKPDEVESLRQTVASHPDKTEKSVVHDQRLGAVPKKEVRFSQPLPEKRGLSYGNMERLDKTQLNNVHHKFQAVLNQFPYQDKVKEVKIKPQRRDKDNLIEFRCRLEGDQKVKIIFHQQEVAPSAYTTGVYIEKSNLKEENQQMVSDLLLKGVEVLRSVNMQNAPRQILTVDSDGDDNLAIQLMAAALRAKLPVQLSDLEYPPDTQEMQSRRIRIEQEARRLANISEGRKMRPPRPKRAGIDKPTA